MEQPLDEIQVTLVPSQTGENEADWQDECQRLVATLRRDLREYDTEVKPVEVLPSAAGTRGITEWSYSTFVFLAHSASLRAALPHIWDILKQWLVPRPGVNGAVVIRSNGAEYSISNLSKDEWLSILERRGEFKKSRPPR